VNGPAAAGDSPLMERAFPRQEATRCRTIVARMLWGGLGTPEAQTTANHPDRR